MGIIHNLQKRFHHFIDSHTKAVIIMDCIWLISGVVLFGFAMLHHNEDITSYLHAYEASTIGKEFLKAYIFGSL